MTMTQPTWTVHSSIAVMQCRGVWQICTVKLSLFVFRNSLKFDIYF